MKYQISLTRILQPKMLDHIQLIPHFKNDIKMRQKRQKEKVKKKFHNRYFLTNFDAQQTSVKVQNYKATVDEKEKGTCLLLNHEPQSLYDS